MSLTFAIDFDATIVRADQPYADVETPLQFMPGALEALTALKAEGHTLVVFSGRANRAKRIDPRLDPLVAAGVRRLDVERFKAGRVLEQARYQQMLDFVAENLEGVIDAVDDGRCGKVAADIFVDDKALGFGLATDRVGWAEIAARYGRAERKGR
ncbi:MAG: hypothetical protein WC700_09155 [Gemmatimonadaceae bacterium]|jgi:hypothetical protein